MCLRICSGLGQIFINFFCSTLLQSCMFNQLINNWTTWVSVLSNWLPPIVLDKLEQRSSEQQAKSCLIRLASAKLYSSSYCCQVTKTSDHSSAELSNLKSGLGNFSGFLLLLLHPGIGWANFKWLSNNFSANWNYCIINVFILKYNIL